MPLKVNEIFYSIQGESTYSGRPCVFIRLSGCNLRCSFCDTQYAYDEGELMEIGDIFNRVSAFECRLVEVTGGEPLIQDETPILIQSLLEDGYEVLLETNGTLDISKIDNRCAKIVDVKCPSSSVAHKNDGDNLTRLTDEDELKFVMGDREDYDYAKKIMGFLDVSLHKKIPINFSPIFGRLNPKDLAKWILEDHLDVRLHLQIHKYIWDPQTRGV